MQGAPLSRLATWLTLTLLLAAVTGGEEKVGLKNQKLGTFVYNGTKSYGWRLGNDDMEVECTVPKVDVVKPGARELFEYYFNNSEPVMLTNLQGRGEFRALVAREPLLRVWGRHYITLSTANTFSHDKLQVPLQAYIDNLLKPQDGKVLGKDLWIWFGDNDHVAWHNLFSRYPLPDFIPDTADTALSFGVGGPNSGVPWHTHGPGYSETLVGRKRWMLYPPDVRPDFDPQKTTFQWMQEGYPRIPKKRKVRGPPENHPTMHQVGRKRWMLYPPDVRPDSQKTTFQWMQEGYPRIPKKRKPQECVVREGEAVWFPPDWWHATLNLDESVFISTFVNYRDRRNAAPGNKLRGGHSEGGHKKGDLPWLFF